MLSAPPRARRPHVRPVQRPAPSAPSTARGVRVGQLAVVLGLAATVALASRYGLEAADRWFGERGAVGIFLLRLVPGMSFDVVSYAAELTGVGFGRFVAATALGVTPQAFLYAWLIREASQSAWALYAASWLLIGVVLMGAVVRVRGRKGLKSPGATNSGPQSARHQA